MTNKLENEYIRDLLAQLHLNTKSADIYFTFETETEVIKVPAHKRVLAKTSSVFDAMFFGPNESLKEMEEIKVFDVSASAYKEFLQLFYLPEVDLSMENIEAVARLADEFKMPYHVDLCAEFLLSRLTQDNIIWAYQLALSINNEKLKHFCSDKIKMLTSDFFKSDQFLTCDRAVLANILQLDSMRIGESELFFACIEWAKVSCEANGLDKNNPENVKTQLGDCFYLIRFGAMTNEEVDFIMSNNQHESLFSRDEVADILCLKIFPNFKSDVFKHTRRTFTWNESESLLCDLKIPSHNPERLQRLHSTWFSTNVPFLLGKVVCIKISDCSTFLAHVTVIEYDNFSFLMNRETKVLHAEIVKFERSSSSPIVPLAEPILILPTKMYEIRLDVHNAGDKCTHCTRWTRELIMDDLQIKIHRGPFEKSDDIRHGAATILHINRI